jgi:hypothetical protein
LHIRDYGDNRHLIAHVAAADPARHALQKRAAWFSTYANRVGKLTAVDLAFCYDGPQARKELEKWLKLTTNG